jgi:uncharacterized DUF497 family protein
MTQYNFEWDQEKAKLNKKKHNVSFEEAATIFHDPHSITIFDDDHTEKEERWITIGISTSGKLLIVCHTYFELSEDSVILRMYSARKTTSIEKKQYRGAK